MRRVAARIYDQKRAEVYERLGIPTVATVRWTADRMVRHLVPEGFADLWRDPTGVIAIVEVPLHHDWLAHPVKALEDATGARVAYLMRFGMGTLGTPSTVIQDGDQVFMLVTDDDDAEAVTTVTAAAPTSERVQTMSGHRGSRKCGLSIASELDRERGRVPLIERHHPCCASGAGAGGGVIPGRCRELGSLEEADWPLRRRGRAPVTTR